MGENNYSKQIFYILLVIGIIICGYTFKALSTVFLPVVFAVFLAFVFFPIVRRLKKRLHIPWILGSILITLLAVILILFISTLLVTSLSTIVSQYPKYETRFLTVYKYIAQTFNLAFDDEKSLFQNMWGLLQVRETLKNFAVTLSSNAVTFSKSLFLVFLLEAFFLIEMQKTNTKITQIFSGERKAKFMRISTNVMTETINYLSIKFFISLATGLIIGLSSWTIGLDFPIVWGFLAFIMNFIPTFGSIISTLLTTLFALIQFYPSLWQTILVFCIMLTVNFVLGNILEPRIEGKNLNLSPFVILVSLTLWGWIWGFMGMILAVPLTVIIKIVSDNIEYLKPIGVLLGNGQSEAKPKNS